MVHVDDVLALLEVGLGRGVLHVLDSLGLRKHVGEREEGRLQRGVGALAHADARREVDGVDHVELDVVVGDVALVLGRQMRLELVEIPLGVDEQRAARLDTRDDGESLGDVCGHVAGDEVCLRDVIR